MKETFEKFLQEMAKLSEGKAGEKGEGGEKPTEERIREAGEAFRKGLDQVPMPEGELWVGKRDLRLYKFSLASNFRQEKPDYKMSLGLELAGTFGKYDRPVKVEAPSSWKEFEQVAEELRQLAPGGAQ